MGPRSRSNFVALHSLIVASLGGSSFGLSGLTRVTNVPAGFRVDLPILSHTVFERRRTIHLTNNCR